jgi:hypothetical protein
VNSLNMGLTGEVNIKMHVEEVEYEDMNWSVWFRSSWVNKVMNKSHKM